MIVVIVLILVIQHVIQILMIIQLIQSWQMVLYLWIWIWFMIMITRKLKFQSSFSCIPQCDTYSVNGKLVLYAIVCNRRWTINRCGACTFCYFRLRSYYIHYCQSIDIYIRLYIVCIYSVQCWITWIELIVFMLLFVVISECIKVVCYFFLCFVWSFVFPIFLLVWQSWWPCITP